MDYVKLDDNTFKTLETIPEKVKETIYNFDDLETEIKELEREETQTADDLSKTQAKLAVKRDLLQQGLAAKLTKL